MIGPRLRVAILVLAALSGVDCRSATLKEMSDCANPRGDAKAAIAACTLVIESGSLSNHNLAVALTDRALGYMQIKAFDQGLKDCNRAVDLWPGDYRTLECRGAMYGSLGKSDLAIESFNEAIRLNPMDEYAFQNRGKTFEDRGDYARAMQDYGVAIRIKPDSYINWNGRCRMRAVMGKDLDGALSDCNQALSIHPNDAKSFNSRGLVYFRKKQYENAIRDYDASIASNPSGASSFYVRGLAKLAMGNAGGSADIARGKSLEPDVAERYGRYGVREAR